ncbi:hypothetical protein J5N97_007109 [Dioscorea zingiberensis]|uniref:BHLH domain-containing protein n=1 Tax=Dioscorea zingiberensis TaxID=325984 RepID=A0A9D5DB83_9LILI|nr:hypothetical protein J5N97_007109 [Dioscorea zingiberensis]
MAAFPYPQQLPINLPYTPLDIPLYQDDHNMFNASHLFPSYFPSESTTPESSISPMAPEEKKVVKQQSSMGKKRKRRDGTCSTSNKLAKDTSGSKSKKEKKKKIKDGEDHPKDYVHVRARRGQATDSHSLAERVRREKISMRFKMLQDLVPGCDKVTGKALMLDEIINYVQSLQNQVEFLSMKLASVNPMLYDLFGGDFDVLTAISQENAGRGGSGARSASNGAWRSL